MIIVIIIIIMIIVTITILHAWCAIFVFLSCDVV